MGENSVRLKEILLAHIGQINFSFLVPSMYNYH